MMAYYGEFKYNFLTTCILRLFSFHSCSLKWLNEHTLLAATAQGNLNAFDARTGSIKFTLTGHHYHVYEFAYKPQESLLLSVSEDTTAKIFKVPPLGD